MDRLIFRCVVLPAAAALALAALTVAASAAPAPTLKDFKCTGTSGIPWADQIA